MSDYQLGKTSLAKLQGVHPNLVKVIQRAIEITGQDFGVNEGLRTVERQKRLFAAGASRTMNSKHIKQADGYGHAADLIPWGDFDGNGTKEISWAWAHFYPIAEAVRLAAKETGVRVRWGGCWQTLNDTDKPAEVLVADYVAARRAEGKKAFIDGPHFELA